MAVRVCFPCFCSRFIATNYPGRCVFNDIKDFVKDASKPYQKLRLAPSLSL